MKMFMVGGFVRDSILGVSSKDIDFTCVLEESDFPAPGTVIFAPDPFDIMRTNLVAQGFKIFLETPQYFTIRAQFPSKDKKIVGNDALDRFAFANPRLTADFVLARQESAYTDGRRPDSVEIGTLEDDLARRDFTMNAIAKDMDGDFIDPFKGAQDIQHKVIRAVGNPQDRLEEDALRAVRALRFSVTKGFRIDPALKFAMETGVVLDAIRTKISDGRINDELTKMFKYSTMESLKALHSYPALTDAMFAGRVGLVPTMKTKGRNLK